MNNIQDKLLILKKGYLIKLKVELSDLKDISLSKNPSFEEIYSKTHKIAGTSGMYGLDEISELSSSIETYLKEHTEQGIEPDELREKLVEYIKNLEELIILGENNG